MLIDELIDIEIELASIASVPKMHRKFVIFAKLSVAEEKIKITKDTLETDIKKLDIVEKNIPNIIRMWFISGGQELTVINLSKEVGTITNIEEKNLILVGREEKEQLEIYNKLQTNVKKDKTIYFSVKYKTNLDNYPKSRDIVFYLEDDSNSFYEYFAPYTKDKYYAKNNYKTSSLQGTKLDTLEYLLKNNIGGLIYFPEFKENKYINIKDAAGFNYNLDILKGDLTVDIKENIMNALSSRNDYSQSNILRLENVMATVADSYIDLGLIREHKTSSLPLTKQTQSDIKNNILRGLNLRYWVQTEIEQVYIKIKEEV